MALRGFDVADKLEESESTSVALLMGEKPEVSESTAVAVTFTLELKGGGIDDTTDGGLLIVGTF